MDLSILQYSLEDEDLGHTLAAWESTTRHSGAYVVPRFYSRHEPESRPDYVRQAHGFGLLKQSENARSCMNDGDEVTIQQGIEDLQYPQDYPRSFTARAMVVRPIAYLTLRMYVHDILHCQILSKCLVHVPTGGHGPMT